MNSFDLTAASLVIVCSLILASVAIPLLSPLLQRYALARPNARSSHRTPTPQGGGVAVIAAIIIVTLACAVLLGLPASLRTQLAIVLAGASLMAILGAIDDIKALPVGLRLSCQALAAILVLVALPDSVRIAPYLPWWIERAGLLVAIVWIINLTNFMDGIDWITVAEIAPVSAGLAFLGLMGALPDHATLVALALLGAVLGFAPFNKPVARLFLGDVGSLPIGLLLGWMLILLAGNGHIAAALLLPLYYLADATITLARRIVRRERFWNAHRHHFYQQAFDRGITVETILTRIFVVNIALIILAVVSVWITSPITSVAALVAGTAIVACLLASFTRARA